MKNKRIFVAALLLLATAFLFTACQQSSNTPVTDPEIPGFPSEPSGLTLKITPVENNQKYDGTYTISGTVKGIPYNQTGKFKIESNQQGPTGIKLIDTKVNGKPDSNMDKYYPFTNGKKITINDYTFDFAKVFQGTPQP